MLCTTNIFISLARARNIPLPLQPSLTTQDMVIVLKVLLAPPLPLFKWAASKLTANLP